MGYPVFKCSGKVPSTNVPASCSHNAGTHKEYKSSTGMILFSPEAADFWAFSVTVAVLGSFAESEAPAPSSSVFELEDSSLTSEVALDPVKFGSLSALLGSSELEQPETKATAVTARIAQGEVRELGISAAYSARAAGFAPMEVKMRIRQPGGNQKLANYHLVVGHFWKGSRGAPF